MISVVLPVYNCQQRLADRVENLLELLPELYAQFELLIIDDASTDATYEVAEELARRYPQVRLVRHRHRGGQPAALRTGMAATEGEMVLLTEEDANLDQFRQLLGQGKQKGVLMAQLAARVPAPPPTIGRLLNWGKKMGNQESAAPTGRFFRREAAETAKQTAPAAPAQRERASRPNSFLSHLIDLARGE